MLAHGCHLHRETDLLVQRGVRGEGGGAAPLFARELLPTERYRAWRMWPIAQQAAGVVVK